MPAISSLIEARQSTHQTGIRQRSLRRHCRLGRATELVFILATGVTLVLGGQAQAQTWDGGGLNANWSTNDNWDTNDDPDTGDAVTINGAGGANANSTVNNNTDNLASVSISASTVTVNATLNSAIVNLTGSGSMTINSGRQVRGSDAPTNTTVNMGSSGTLTNNGTITGIVNVTSGVLDVGATGTVTGNVTLAGQLNIGNSSAVGGSISTSGNAIISYANGVNEASGITLGTPATIFNAGTGVSATQSGIIGESVAGNGILKNGLGSITLTGVNTFTGTTNVAEGTLSITGAGTIASTIVETGSTATLAVDGGALASGAAVTSAGVFSVSGAETIASLNQTGGTVNGGNTLTVTGTFAQSGGGILASGTTVNAGGAKTLSGGTIAGILGGAGATTVQTGQTDLSGSISGNVAVSAGGTLNASTGTVTGNVALAGQLNIANSNAVTGTITTTGNAIISYAGGVDETSNTTLNTVTTILNAGSGVAATHTGIISELAVGSGLFKNGLGNITVNGNNTFTGATTVNQGTLTISNAGALGVGAGATTVDAGATLALSGGITTNEAIFLNGTNVGGIGALHNVAGSNTATGTITLQSASSITAATATTLALNGGLVNGGFGLTLGGAGTINVGGVISGTGALIKEGAGTASLTNTNTFAGATTVNAGILSVSGGNALSDTGLLTVTSPGALTVTGGAVEVVGNLAGNGNITLTAATDGLTAGNATPTSTYSGVMSGLGTFTKQGTGTLILSGANTYTGTTTVGDGVTGGGVMDVTGSIASLSNVVNLGSTLRVDGASLDNSATVTLNGTGILDVAGDLEQIAGLISASATSSVTLGGNTLVLNGNLPVDPATNTTTFAGVISGTGGLIKTGTDIQVLSGTNTYTGTTTVAGGELHLNGGAAIVNTNAVAVNGGRLEINTSETIGTLAGLAVGTVDLNANTLTIGSNATAGVQSTTFAGVIEGSGALTKSGIDTQLLSGTNTYTGLTTVNDGTLEVTGQIAGNVVVDGTGRLRIGNSTAIGGTITTTGSVVSYANAVDEGSALIISSADTDLEVLGTDAATQSGIISSTGVFGFEKIGTGTLTVSGTNTYTGATTVSAGTLVVTNDAGLGATGVGAGTTIASGAALGLSGVLTVAEAISVSGTGILNGGAIRNISGNNVISGAITLTGATRINSDLDQIEFTGGITGTNQNLTLGGAGTVFVDSAITTGSGTLTKDGAGITALGATNSFTGATTVNDGFLQLQNAGSKLSDTALLTVNAPGVVQVFASETVGNVTGAGGIAISGGATLTAGDTTNQTFSGIISNDVVVGGAFTKAGTGTLTLSNANTYTGLTTVNAGALRVDGSVASAVEVNTTGTLQGSGTVVGNVTVNSGGTLAAGDGVGDAGVLTIGGNLVLNAGSTTRFDLPTASQNAAVTNDRINVTGTVTLGGTLTVDSTLANGYYRLMNTTGGASGTFATSPVGATVLTNVTGQVNLRVGTAAPTQFWDGANFTDNGTVNGGVGTWNATSTNWTTSNGQFNDGWLSGEGVFGGAAGGTVTINGAQTFQGLTFNTAGYVLDGPGTLVSPTTGGFSNLTTNADATINAAITGAGGINKLGTGVLTLGGVSTYLGSTDVAVGTLRTSVNNALPGTSNVNVFNGATLDVIGTEQIVGALTGGATATLALGAGGRLASGGSANTIFAGNVTGNNSSVLDYNGSGSLTLTGASTMTGTMAALAGRLELGAGATTAALRVGALNNGTFVTNGGALVSNATVVTGAAGSTVRLSGSETVGALTNGGFPSAAGVGIINLNGTGVILTVNGTSGSSGIAGSVTGTGTLNVTGDTTTVTAAGNVATATTIGASGTVLNNGTMAGVTNAGTFTNNLTAASVSSSGTTTNAGAITTTLAVTGGTTTNTGSVGGATTVSGGTLEQDAGTLNGLAISAGVVNADGGTINGATSLTAGILNANGAAFGATPIANNGGAINVTANTTGSVNNNTGTLIVNAGAALTGTVVNAATATIASGGSVAGNVTNSGTLNLNGGITSGGNLTNSGTVLASGGAVSGNVLNQSGGQFTVAPGAAAGVGGTLTNASGATTTINTGSNLTAAVINQTGGTLSTAGTLTGTLNNAGAVSATTATFAGAVTNAGTIIGTGALTFGAALNNQSAGTINAASLSVTGAAINAGSVTTSGAANFAGLTNPGTLTAATVAVTGLTNNAGTITTSGNMNLAGGMSGGGRLNVQSGPGDTADVITVGGAGITQGATLQFDVDLTIGTGDRLVLAGAGLNGTLNFALNATGANSGDLPPFVLVQDYGAGSTFDIGTVAGLPVAGGKFAYFVTNDAANSDVVLSSILNPGIGAIAGSVTLTQSLIGSVINRPSSPFVTGLAFDDADPCGPGVWARATGGQANASGKNVSNPGLFDEFASETNLSASFAGVQLGGDFACFNGSVRGWDLAAGGIGGLNRGSLNLPVGVPDPTTGVGTIITSQTDAKFSQTYAGLYVTAARGPLAFDLQYRIEKTDLTVNNTPVAGFASLGLTDEEFSSDAKTLSGSLSYAFPIKDTNIVVVPTAGFALTRTSTDVINFDNGTDSLQLDDFSNNRAFIGATVARTIFGDSETSFSRQFVTATYYGDFAKDPTSVFTFDDSGTERTQTVVNENLGSYGEISVGLNYVKIFDDGMAIPARQLDASIRADARFGGQLDSWGLTGQLRLQF